MKKELLPDMKNFKMHSEELFSRTNALDTCLKELSIPDNQKQEFIDCFTEMMYSVAATAFLTGYHCGQKSKK